MAIRNGHAWLEFNKDDTWNHYEPTNNDLNPDVDINVDSIDELVKDKRVLNPHGGELSSHNTFQVDENGRRNADINFSNSLRNNLGVSLDDGNSLYQIEDFQYGGPH